MVTQKLRLGDIKDDPAVVAKVESIYTSGVEALNQGCIQLFEGFRRENVLNQFGAFCTITTATHSALEDRFFGPLRQIIKELGFTAYVALDHFEPHITVFTAKGTSESFDMFVSDNRLPEIKNQIIGQQVALSRVLPDKANMLLATHHIPESFSALRMSMSRVCSNAGLTTSIPDNLLHMTALRIMSAVPKHFSEYLLRLQREVEQPILVEPIVVEFADCRICSVADLLRLP